MSIALLVLSSIAGVLVLGLLGALTWLSRVEREHEQTVGVATSTRPRHLGASGDVHLALGFAEADAAFVDEVLGRHRGELQPEAMEALVSDSRALLGRADSAAIEYGHFRPISFRRDASARVAYARFRVRTPVTQVASARSRAELERTLDDLAAMGAAGAVELWLSKAKLTTDSAAPALVRLDPPPSGV